MRPLARLLISPFLVAALVACSLPGSPAPTSPPAGTATSPFKLTIADRGQTIALPVGSEIDVTLQTIGPGQYATPQVSSAAVRYLDESLVTPFVPAGPTQLFRFQVVAPGQATISIQSTAGNPTFAVTVTASLK